MIATLVVAGAAFADPQVESQPTFRSDIDYVQIPVRVLDARGQLVRGLAQSDFQILEDGRPRLRIRSRQSEYGCGGLRARHVLRRFVRGGIAANDMAAIVLTGSGRGEPFTRNPQLIVAAIHRLMSDADPSDNSAERVDPLGAVPTHGAPAEAAEAPGRRPPVIVRGPLDAGRYLAEESGGFAVVNSDGNTTLRVRNKSSLVREMRRVARLLHPVPHD